jgi:hypothetical protein
VPQSPFLNAQRKTRENRPKLFQGKKWPTRNRLARQITFIRRRAKLQFWEVRTNWTHWSLQYKSFFNQFRTPTCKQSASTTNMEVWKTGNQIQPAKCKIQQI